MKRIESERVQNFFRVGISATLLSTLSACGLLESKMDVKLCPSDRSEQEVVSDGILSFDKTKMAVVFCRDGRAMLTVTDLKSSEIILFEDTGFRTIVGLALSWSPDGKKVWVNIPSQSSFFYSFPLPEEAKK